MSVGLGLARIGQIAIPVQDVAAAARFYRSALGMKCISEIRELAIFECGEVRLILAKPEEPAPALSGSSCVVYFTVENIHTACNTLVTRGVRFLGKPHVVARTPDSETWVAFFRDADENTLALMSEVWIGLPEIDPEEETA